MKPERSPKMSQKKSEKGVTQSWIVVRNLGSKRGGRGKGEMPIVPRTWLINAQSNRQTGEKQSKS